MSAAMVALCVVGMAVAADRARGALVLRRTALLGRERYARRWPVSLAAAHLRWWPGRAGRDARRLARGMPDALDAVARSLRSGTTLPVALQEAAGAGGPAGDALAEVGIRARHGMGVAEETARWAETSGLASVRAAATALTLAASGAASPTRGIEAVAEALRAEHAAAAEIRTQSTQARLSAAVLAALPVAFAAWVAATRPEALAFLVGTPTGLTCLAVGVVLELVGLLWIAAILREVG